MLAPADHPTLRLLSTGLGWLYTGLWSLSFYPQIILNFQRKSVTGFSQDFAHLNVVGFLAYSVYNLSFLFSKEVQQEYKDRHGGQVNVVRGNDAAFAVHAFACASIQLAQSYWYHDWSKDRKHSLAAATGNQGTSHDYNDDNAPTTSSAHDSAPSQPNSEETPQVSPFARASLLAILVVVLATSALSFLPSHPLLHLYPLDFINTLAYIKLYISTVKYLPQISLNHRRKSTQGFSVENVLLDASGGILSFAQLVLDAGLINGDWSGVTGNPGKLGLSFLSLFFDLILSLQHFVLYRSNNQRIDSEESRPLLG